jgi:hypothetical protein
MTWFAPLALALTLLAAERALACAGCSNPNLPQGGTGAVLIEPASLRVRVASTATAVHVVHTESCPDIGPVCSERDEPPQLHDQHLYLGELRGVLTYGLTRHLAAELQVPFRAVRTTITYRRLDGTAFTPPYATIHHRDESLFGLGDPVIAGRVTTSLSRLWLGASLGASLPVGRTEADPFRLGELGRAHQHIQFGTGTFNPVLALDAAWRTGEVTLSAQAQALTPLHENRHGYRAGTRISGGVGGRLDLAPWSLGVSGDVLHESAERWGGEVKQDGNLGRTDVLAGLSGGLDVAGYEVTLTARVPVHTRLVSYGDEAGQLSFPLVLGLSVTTTLGGG